MTTRSFDHPGTGKQVLRAVADWDDAYANAVHIAGGDRWPAAWVEPARAFRAAHSLQEIAYGGTERERLDLFRPSGKARGLVAFLHGGYWMALDRSYWSHLARGALERGWAVVIPSYPLAPDVRVGEIVRSVARAIGAAAALVSGPVRLVGHSAGGHLAARMVCEDSPLGAADRVVRTVSISGLHDLRPLLATRLNETLRLDEAEATAQSPALLRPRAGTALVAWVGAAERAEFVRQAELLANVWRGLGARTQCVHEPDRHHFDVIDGLADPSSPLTAALLGD